MSKTTTKLVSMTRLADQGELGGIMVRLMMVIQDFALANHAMGSWKAEKDGKYKHRHIAAGRYFLRLQMSHILEAFELVEEIQKSDELKAAVLACDKQTRKSFEALEAFMNGEDYKLLLVIRNTIGFHYGRKLVLQSLARIKERLEKQRAEKKNADDLVGITLGHEALDWHFVPTEWVENDIVVRGIFKIPEGQPMDDQQKSDEIVDRLHEIAKTFADFGGHFIRHHAKA
jgi:hypothetical protein